jgi:hypothetical protein
MKNNNDPEIFESNDDAVDNFDTLNDVYRKDTNWIKEGINESDGSEIKKEDFNPAIAFKSLYLPGQNLQSLDYDIEFKDGETDPYQRICNLKYELIDCKTKIDTYAKNFNDNSFIKENENVGKIIEELDLYKAKIDAFIDYNIFKKTDDDSIDDDKSSLSTSKIDKKEFQSSFDKYVRITENLISQVKQNEKDILSNQLGGDFNIKYEICANPQMQMESLVEKIGQLEDMMNNLENNIGNWDIVIYTNNT